MTETQMCYNTIWYLCTMHFGNHCRVWTTDIKHLALHRVGRVRVIVLAG